jgi:hypothetical protein
MVEYLVKHRDKFTLHLWKHRDNFTLHLWITMVSNSTPKYPLISLFFYEWAMPPYV